MREITENYHKFVELGRELDDYRKHFLYPAWDQKQQGVYSETDAWADFLEAREDYWADQLHELWVYKLNDYERAILDFMPCRSVTPNVRAYLQAWADLLTYWLSLSDPEVLEDEELEDVYMDEVRAAGYALTTQEEIYLEVRFVSKIEKTEPEDLLDLAHGLLQETSEE